MLENSDADTPRSPDATEETLDPSSPAEWEALRALGHRMWDDTLDSLRDVRERPVWRSVPDEVRRALSAPAPLEPEPLERVYEELQRDVLPYPTGNTHPRFWGWVMGTGTPVGVLAEMLTAGMNSNVGGLDHSATLVENQTIRWLSELLGYPSQASGVLVSGGTMANLIGLTVARSAKAGFDVRIDGLQGAQPRLMVYASTETHSWTIKACELLGLGRRALRQVPVNARYQTDIDALRRMIAEDRAAGHRPICVVGTAGTVNTGATDDLRALGALCRDEDLWFHVDGAFGALAALSPELREIVAGMEQADSLAFDLHKWGYIPYEVGCVLVRDEKAHRATFSLTPEYLRPAARGLAVDPGYFADLGVQLSRNFRALKVWMSLKSQGGNAWGRLVHQNVMQARHLASLVEAHAELELLAPVALNVVCFRYVAPGLTQDQLNALNAELLLLLQERGIAVPSSTTLGGRFAIRVANTNHRTRTEDLDALATAVVQIGRELVAAAHAERAEPRSAVTSH